MVNKVIILKGGGGELANQLWNYASIYAFGLETGAAVRNPSFFEYHSFFRFLPHESVFTRLSALFFRTPRRRYHWINRIGRTLYAVRVRISSVVHTKCLWSSQNNQNKPAYLPPTENLPERYASCDSVYTIGWLFRNPKGLEKHRDEIIEAFTPIYEIQTRIQNIITPLRQKYEKIIGIHIRQSDYSVFKGGKYLVTEDAVRKAIDTYIQKEALDRNNMVFLIASDGPINETKYQSLNIVVSKENAVTDLFLLAKTDVILGSHSTFNAFAAWYGGIKRIFFDTILAS